MTATVPAAPDLTSRDIYRFWSKDHVRFQDVDRVGHLNNVAFAVFAETGRVAMFEKLTPNSTAGEGHGWVIVRLVIDYRAQGHYQDQIDIGTKVTRIGNSSCSVAQGIFVGDTCIATVDSVCVWTDIPNGKALPFPPDLRAALESLL